MNSTLPDGGVQTAGQDLGLTGGVVAGSTNNNNKSLTFGTSSSGYENVVVSFASRRTNTGFNSVQFAYSTDGSNFINFGSSYTPTSNYTGSLKTFDLSSVVAVADNPNALFRLTFNGASGGASADNNRLDNIQINGTKIAVAVPEAGAGILVILPGVVLGVFALCRRKIGSGT